MTLKIFDKRETDIASDGLLPGYKDTFESGRHYISDIINSVPLKINGYPIFALRIKKALKILGADEAGNLLHNLSIMVIIPGQNLRYDGELGILYIDRNLSVIEIAAVIRILAGKENNSEITVDDVLKQSSKRNYTGLINRVNRRIFRQSLEKRLENYIQKIISSPPMGQVATEDQHFLMTIMRLEMFVRSISGKIEKNSIVSILERQRKKLHKRLLSCQKRSIAGPEDTEGTVIKEMMETLDSRIFEKKMVIQNRLLDRLFKSIDKWPEYETSGKYCIRKISSRLLPVIKKAGEILERTQIKDSPVYSFRDKFVQKQIIRLKKKRMKIDYINSVNDRKKEYAERLKQYLAIKHRNELIPEGYKKSFLSIFFDIFRVSLNVLFISSYIYLIDIPVFFVPVFLAVGLFVFQSIANKFAIMFISIFVKNGGLKRLPGYKLKEEIKKRADGSKYFCAIDLPLYTDSLPELETTVHYIKRNLSNLKNTIDYFDNLCMVYQITSNTSDEILADKEVSMARKVQKIADALLGKDRVFFLYLHRNSGKAKKVGNIIASHLFKYRGITSPDIYTDQKRFLLTFEKKPFFDRAWGDFKKTLVPGGKDNSFIIQDILKGNRINIAGNIEFTFFIDNKNEIKPGSFEKALAIMMHPANKNISILQPKMSIEDPVSEGQKITSAFLRMMRLARDVHNERYLNTLHSLYGNMSAYYGKGMVRLRMYDYMITREVLNIKYVDSHDWQESVFNNCAIALSGNKKIQITRKDGPDDSFDVLIEEKRNSSIFNLKFNGNCCIMKDERGNLRNIIVRGHDLESRVRQALSYVDNGVEVGERELISTIGNNTRDSRWLKGDLQMFNTFMPYFKFLPAYHRFHLENIFRRLTNEIGLLLWVGINFIFAISAGSTGGMNQELLFILSLYLGATAFGFAGIDLYIYPIFFDISDRIRMPGSSGFKS
ncbi:MAG: hypothetical protein JW770_05625, partial [Actinobacteria bacterium]|nr:hypothetical protein [Actinomycetota bacterium]